MLQVTEESEAGERWAKWIYVGIAYAALLSVLTWALLQPELTPRPSLTIGLSVVTAVWLVGFIAWWPKWPRRRVWSIVGYVGLVALNTGLIASSEAFTAFVWIGFPFAFAIFPARWAVFAVTANAFCTFVVRNDAMRDSSPYMVMLAVAGPVIFAGWYVGVESERRKKAITQLTDANRRLTSAMEENAGLHAQLLVQAREAGVLDERQRMAREIHDTLAQELAAMIRQLQAADRVRDQPAQWQHHMDQVQLLARRSLEEARRSVQALRPAPLEQSRLPDAINEMAQAWSRTSAVPLKVDFTGTQVPLITGIEVALFRVAQEALANVAKHARASRVGITLSYLDDVVLLDIRDDGVGFEPAATAPTGLMLDPASRSSELMLDPASRSSELMLDPASRSSELMLDPASRSSVDSGYGLSTMRQRLLGVGGTLEIESGPGEGTAIGASVPAIRAEGMPE